MINTEYIIKDLPTRLNDRIDLDKILSHAHSIDASDVFLMSGYPVKATRHSKLVNLSTPNRKVSDNEVLSVLKDFYGINAQAKLGAGEPIDTSYDFIDNVTDERLRFRVNASPCLRQGRQGYTITFRSIPTTPPKPMDVPLEILEVCRSSVQGLILVVGATGNGKSTLLASILRDILEKEDSNTNLITLESPIEFVYDYLDMPSSIVTQMEVGKHINNFSEGVTNTLRMAPKIILVGESRDYETISASVEASTTGHTVFSTLHANSVSETIMRLVNVYPKDLQNQAMLDILTAMKLVIAQRLVPKIGGGRVALREYLLFSSDVKKEVQNSTNLTTTLNSIVKRNGTSMLDYASKLVLDGIILEKTYDLIKNNYE
jgi:defect-in-organelle-trafficking protein DotB